MLQDTGRAPLRLLLDTNVVVAGLLWSGPPRRLIELAIAAETVELFSSPALVAELADTLRYPKFAPRIAQLATGVETLLVQYCPFVHDDMGSGQLGWHGPTVVSSP